MPPEACVASSLVIHEATLQAVRMDSGTSSANPKLSATSVVTKILDATRSLIGIKDGDGRYVLANGPMMEFHDLSRETFIGRTADEIGMTGTSAWAEVPDDASSHPEPLIRRDVELSDATGRRRRFDIVYQTATSADDGSRYVIEVANETFEPEATPPSWLLAALPAASFHCDVRPGSLRLTFLDKAAEDFFGSPASELLGKIEKLLVYAHDGAVEERRQKWQALAVQRDAWDEELEIRSAHGEPRWLRIAAQPSARNPNEYRGVIVDITTTKQAHARRAEDEQRLELALVNGGLGLVDWHIASGRLAPNRQLSRLLDLDDGEFIGTASELSSFEHPKDNERIHAELQAHLQGQSPEFHCEYRLRTARGEVRWVLANGHVMTRAPDGSALRYLGTLQHVPQPPNVGRELEKQVARSRAVTRISSQISSHLAREVRQLEAEIRDISHREQARIGRDLHDGLGQELTGVSLMLKGLEHAIEHDAPKFGSKIRSVRDMVDQCIATTRALAQGLSPVHLDRDGFAGALEQLAATSESFFGLPVRFSCQHNGASPEHGAATDLYRIAQEAISNAARHSGAHEINLHLFADADQLVVTVEDDGGGIPASAAKKDGMGLKIMRYRATIIGASLEIGSREGGGTVVRCTLRHPVVGAA
ncbi:MAG TPA: PAS domain-containing protein [Gammaproteobacteria bacterium]|nr:PAS domain-containing protein [Gammaproteobacteria bacterium]